MALAAEGPIVVFNSTLLRSDALIVTTTAITAAALPNLDFSEFISQMENMTCELVRGRRSK